MTAAGKGRGEAAPGPSAPGGRQVEGRLAMVGTLN